ncbi:MAG TPA: VanW family protein [Gaiellaceae bacterium]
MRPGLIALAVLVGLLLVAGIGFSGSASQIPAGVTIAGVDVGGLTAEEAQAKLADTAREYASVPMVFIAAGGRYPIRPDAVDARADWAAAVSAALEHGDGPLPIRGLERLWLRFTGAEVDPPVDVDEVALRARIDHVAGEVDRPAREASIVLAGLTPQILPESAGRELDRTAARGVVAASLGGFEREETPLPVAVDEPVVTRTELVPVAAQVRTVLSEPVRLTIGAAAVTVRPREMARLLALPADGVAKLQIDAKAAAGFFENIAHGVARPPRDAGFAVRPDGRARLVPSRPGRELDVPATSAALVRAASRTMNRSAELVVDEKAPQFVTQEARALGIRRQLASYVTLYSGTPDRITNLQRAIDLLDGARIAPGAVFSMNARLGPRTLERGFRPAPVILDGKYEEGVGGGVSQVATTVFNAAWEAGIRIAERHAHALYISRYPTGRDATLNYPDVDLKLENDTGRWIAIEASYDESGIIVRLLGSGPERRVESIPGELEDTGKPQVEREPDPDLFVGEKLVEDYGEPSREVSVQRIVYRGDEVLYRETWNTAYRSEPKLVHVGTKPLPATEEEEPKPKPKSDEAPGR